MDEEQFNTLSTGENQLETCSEPYDNFTVQAQCGSCGKYSLRLKCLTSSFRILLVITKYKV